MTYNFGDSFDLYTAAADPNGYWDSIGPSGVSSFNPGRFGGRCAIFNTNTVLTKSGVNDPVHHVTFSFYQSQPISGSSMWQNFQLFDGATAQCTVNFRSDGAIVLTSGGPGGAVLATYIGAFLGQNVWYGFEFEVVINGTTGSFAVRKNGNAANDFTATGLNTAPSGNATANKLVASTGGNSVQGVDDLYWRSGASAGAWLGELRCLTRMPTTDQSVAFAKSPVSPALQTPFVATTTQTSSATSGWYTPFVAAYDGTLGSFTVSIATGFTGNLKSTLFADNGSGAPGAIIASAPTLANPVTGNNTITFGSPPALAKGVKYWIGFSTDGAYTNAYNVLANNGFGSTTAYAAFPVANPTNSGFAPAISITVALTIGNHSVVADPQQDGVASYVFDSTPGDQDFYGIAAAATSTPFSTVAVITRGYMQKSDAGTRTAAVSVKSGATIVATPTLALSTSGFQWTSRLDLVDPNTSAAWTAAAVAALQVGPKVVA